MSQEHLFPIHDHMLPPADKESLLGQNGMVFWLTGLSGAGKTTLALAVERILHERGLLVRLLDGDNIRGRLNADLGFSMADRQENIRRIAEVARLFRETGIVTLCAFICPTMALRSMARATIGADHYREIFVAASLATCEARDPKGLYQKARAGVIPDFTGIHSPYEAPSAPDLLVPTDQQSVADSARLLATYILHETGVRP